MLMNVPRRKPMDEHDERGWTLVPIYYSLKLILSIKSGISLTIFFILEMDTVESLQILSLGSKYFLTLIES